MRQFSVLFVCMGNICRSPTVEAVFRHHVAIGGLHDRVFSDSAGTHDYHTGKPPDTRAQLAAMRRGYDMSRLRARQVCAGDFAKFDCILAMDRENLRLLQQQCAAELRGKLMLFMHFASQAATHEVPDPYYGGEEGFEQVLDMVEDAAQGLLRHIRVQLTA
jgi:protein-tyrosine phosphatase